MVGGFRHDLILAKALVGYVDCTARVLHIAWNMLLANF